jgi:CBS domain containing-hemolysin-like protein
MDSLIAVAIIAGLILLNGIFVAAEFAIVAAPRLAIERRARAGQRIARLVHRVLADAREQDRFIATAQLGITLASLGLGMYGEHVLAGWIAAGLEALGGAQWIAAHAVAAGAAVIVLTYFHIVVGEMVPKSLALLHAERTVLGITPLLLCTKWIFYLIVVALNGTGNAALRLMGIDRRQAGHHRYYTPEELALVVQESQEAGVLPSESGRLIREIFEFGDLVAAQVMTPRVRVIGVAVGSGPEAIRAVLRSAPHTRYAVYQDNLDQALGMIHIKELLRLVLAGRHIELHHARPMPTVPETALLDGVLAAMRRQRAQMALVVDEYGGTAGIVTLQDLFEEVVGKVEEGGFATIDMYVDAAGRLRAPGTARLDEVAERLGVALEHEEVESVSGLVLTLLGRPPQPGDSVSYAALRFEVTAVQGYGVAECAISLAPNAPD